VESSDGELLPKKKITIMDRLWKAATVSYCPKKNNKKKITIMDRLWKAATVSYCPTTFCSSILSRMAKRYSVTVSKET
jgi:hypothetical protein